ncbi:hypothetical protein SAMN04489716_8575 [Actinoplanes derwentensis]|uniref:Uncharacterized protein n=1 Tax=Actinoplanes derwentensis TaxID=113562 RepID=A0A1H2D870_9ACTN|nr:hypothetical protein SAMN04489716_8575 [Actinoplanes derwentensis]
MKAATANKPPRPILRAALVGLAGGAAVGAGRYDALTEPGGPGILWRPLLISVSFILLAILGAGAATYFASKKDLNENNRNAAEADQAIRSRSLLLATINSVTGAQNELVSLKGDQRLPEFSGRFKQVATDAVAKMTLILQGDTGDGAGVRVMFAEYDQSKMEVILDGTQILAEHGEFPDGKLEKSDLNIDATYPELMKAANEFANGDVGCRDGDAQARAPELTRLRSPDQPSHYVRIKIASGKQIHGVMFVDIWGSTLLPKSDLHLMLSVARLLSAGLAAVAEP